MLRKIFTVSVVVLTIFWAVGLAAFVPTAQAAVSSGDLIRASLPAVYYYGADGKRYTFTNSKNYNTWYPDFSGVKTITDGELQTYPLGGNVTYRPGVKMIKINTDPKVYAVAANGTLRWVTTASIAACLYGSNWGTMIDDVNDVFFFNYTVGAEITDCTQYTPSTATAAAQSINVDKGLAGATSGGNLNVTLASDTPASQTVAAGASANMTKIILAAGSAAVTVNSLYVTRSGLSSNDDILNIKLVGTNGATVGSVASLGSNSKALVTFVPSLQLAANTTLPLFIRASIKGLPAPAPSGNTVALAIATASDVVLAAGTVTGAFPVTGNYMSVVQLANLGGAVVDKNALPPDSKPDAGAKRVQVSQFEVNATAGEDLTVDNIGLMEAGSASVADYANIELYSLTESRTLGTVATWDANARATFGNLNVVIPKGAKHIFEVFTDVTGGSGNTLNVDLSDGNTDVLVVVKGNTYGFYLTPVITSGWDGKGMDQTVGKGILNVTKDISSPATGNITQASEQALTTWAFEVRGEAAKITSTKVTLTLGGALGILNLTNARLVDETGTTVAGPKAVIANTVTFTETYIVPTGTHKFTFKIDVISNGGVAAAGSISAGIVAPATDISATGMNTRDNVKISTAVSNGNTQTILPVALTVTTLTQPAARSVSVGTQNYVYATASLDASASGEDVRVTAVEVQDTSLKASGTITGNTAVAATVVTTAAPHLLVTGDSITISGSNSTPAINGTYIVTVTGANTFTIPVTVTVAGNAGAFVAAGLTDFTAIQNLTIWADLTSENSSRGDAYETKISTSEQPVAGVATKAIALNPLVNVPKGSFVKIAVVGDLSTNAATATGSSHQLKISAVTASGKLTGNVPLGLTYPGTGQVMTNAGAGVLTLTVNSTTPNSMIFTSGLQKQTVAVFKAAASKVEDMDLDKVIITDNSLTGDVVAIDWYLYSNVRSDGNSTADYVSHGTMDSVSKTVTFNLNDGIVTIPADGNVLLTVKVDVASVDGTTVQNGDDLKPEILATTDIQATGKSSGAIINAVAAATATNSHYAYAAAPISWAMPTSMQPPTLISNSTEALVAVIQATAQANDVTFVGGTADKLTMTVNAFGGGAANCVLKDGDGNILDDTAAANLAGAGTVTFDFVNTALPLNRTLTLAKGVTQTLKVFCDSTSLFAGGGNGSVGISLAPNAGAGLSNIIYSINGGVVHIGDMAATAPAIDDYIDDVLWRGNVVGITLNDGQ